MNLWTLVLNVSTLGRKFMILYPIGSNSDEKNGKHIYRRHIKWDQKKQNAESSKVCIMNVQEDNTEGSWMMFA